MPVAYRDGRPKRRTHPSPGSTRGATLVLRIRGRLAGLTALALGLSAGAPGVVADFGATRTISLYHIHTKETLTVTYKKDGKYVPEALKKLNWHLRDWRENKEIEMDPKTIDLLWEMHTELGSKEPISIICGYRSEKTNGMLRRTVGGQAKGSYHIRGMAIDAAFPDIPVKQMRYSALIRELGGVGYYPTSGIPFVHVDSGPVRAWPRLPRYELALLFPNGATKHRPSGGGPITREDVRVAQTRHKELATQVAQFFDIRNKPHAPYAVAEATPIEAPAPQPVQRARVASAEEAPQAAALSTAEPKPVLTSPPQLMRSVARPAPSEEERRGLNALVSLASLTPPVGGPPKADRDRLAKLVSASIEAEAKPPAAANVMPSLVPAAAAPPASRAEGWNDGWAPAPAFDDDHPEELSYRPFPVAPFLTQSASADDDALVKLAHPDLARTLDLLDDAPVVLPLRLRPGRQVTEVMWAQQFRGEAVDISVLEEAESARSAPASLASRSVRTTAR